MEKGIKEYTLFALPAVEVSHLCVVVSFHWMTHKSGVGPPPVRAVPSNATATAHISKHDIHLDMYQQKRYFGGTGRRAKRTGNK